MRTDLPTGTLARQVWFGGRYLLLVNSHISDADVAWLALHALRGHPVEALGDWDTVVCAATSCDVASEYVAHLSERELILAYLTAQPS